MEDIQKLEKMLAETQRKSECVEKRTKQLEIISHAKGVPENKIQKLLVQPKRNEKWNKTAA